MRNSWVDESCRSVVFVWYLKENNQLEMMARWCFFVSKMHCFHKLFKAFFKSAIDFWEDDFPLDEDKRY